MFFYLPKFKGSHLSGLAGQPWDCFKICLYLFDCGEVFWRKIWLRKIRDRNPHGVPKKWRKGAGHILGSLFLLLGLDPVESFRSQFLVTAQHIMKNVPKMRRSTPIENCWKNLQKKKTDSVEPMFFALDFSSLRIYHFWTAPVIELMNRHQGTCIKISHLQFLDTTTGQIVGVHINLEASRVNATPSGCFS